MEMGSKEKGEENLSFRTELKGNKQVEAVESVL